jgi:hypothetical protein
MHRLFILTLTAATFLLPAADKYSGPRPPKADLPYLVHADNLVPTEAGVARQEDRKDATVYIMNGAASSAKTPLAEPIFILKTEKLIPDKLSVFRMEVRNGNREVVVPTKKVKNPPKPIPLKVTKLDDRLYRIEVDNPLDNGEYTLSPDGSNDAFAFEIY